jgi:hypothetical protein
MSEMAYDYIQQVYGAAFYPGDMVAHTETSQRGLVIEPQESHLHYVRTDFGLCHPRALKIMARGEAWGAAQTGEP